MIKLWTLARNWNSSMDRIKILVKILSLLLIVGGNFLPTTVTAKNLRVGINKTQVIELSQPAAVVSVANPNIADVTVQSPRVILVIGKATGDWEPSATSSGLLDSLPRRCLSLIFPSLTSSVEHFLASDAEWGTILVGLQGTISFYSGR